MNWFRGVSAGFGDTIAGTMRGVFASRRLHLLLLASLLACKADEGGDEGPVGTVLAEKTLTIGGGTPVTVMLGSGPRSTQVEFPATVTRAPTMVTVRLTEMVGKTRAVPVGPVVHVATRNVNLQRPGRMRQSVAPPPAMRGYRTVTAPPPAPEWSVYPVPARRIGGQRVGADGDAGIADAGGGDALAPIAQPQILNETWEGDIGGSGLWAIALGDPDVPPPLPLSGGDPSPCTESSTDCGCTQILADRPLSTLAQANVGRRIKMMCHDPVNDTLSVLSYTVDPNNMQFTVPDQHYVTVHRGADLVPQSDTPTDEDVLTTGNCAPYPTRAGVIYGADVHIRGTLGPGLGWRVSYQDMNNNAWIQSVLNVGAGALRFSMNGAVNRPTPVDTDSLFDNTAGAAARVHPSGSARFYLHNWHAFSIDIVHVDDLNAMVANPSAFENPMTGYTDPTFNQRLTLQPDAFSNFTTNYQTLYAFEAPDDPNADIIMVFSHAQIRAFRVSRGLAGLDITEMGPLQLDGFWGQFGYAPGGVDARGVFYTTAEVASFNSSRTMALDPGSFSRVGEWEMGCIGSPGTDGFATIPYEAGLMLRFTSDLSFLPPDSIAAMFIRDGQLEAIGPVQTDLRAVSLLTGPEHRRIYLAHPDTGAITAIAVPQ